ncbi:MAG: hypothetical protein AAB426_05545 [Myxococcota bacterium]
MRRALSELAAPARTTGDAALAGHDLILSARVRWGTRLSLGYEDRLLLRLEDATADVNRPSFQSHGLTIAYRSPCDCWAIEVRATTTPLPTANAGVLSEQLTGARRITFNFAIGDYRVGSQ